MFNNEYIYKSFGWRGLETLVASYHRGDRVTMINVTFETGWFKRRSCFVTFLIRNEIHDKYMLIPSEAMPQWKTWSSTGLFENASAACNVFCNEAAGGFGTWKVTKELLQELRSLTRPRTVQS